MMNEAVFKYDAKFKKKMGKAGTWHKPEGMKDPLEMLVAFARFQLSRIESLIKDRPAEALYHVLMDFRDVEPAFFPPYDICLLAANAMLGIGEGKAVALLDWRFLPAAVLLAGKGTRINVPAEHEIAAILKEQIPMGGWESGTDGVALGINPDVMAEKDADFIDRLKQAHGGVLVCGTYFLDRNSLSHLRTTMLKNGLVKAVLQIPKPRRQKATFHPAIMTFDGNVAEKVRLAAIDKCAPGASSVDMDLCMELLWGEADGQNSVDVPVDDLLKDGKCNLYPHTWLGGEKPKGNTTLGQLAQVIRSSVRRRKVEDGTKIGERGDGTLVCREITFSDLDPVTGFVPPTGGTLTRAQVTETGLMGRLLLDKGDIVLVYRGTENSLGRVGLVEKKGEWAIPCQAMCVVRALPDTDPVWLFYALRSPKIAEYVGNRASGGRERMASMETIRNLPLEKPDKAMVEQVNAIHARIVENAENIERIKGEMASETEEILGLFESGRHL